MHETIFMLLMSSIHASGIIATPSQGCGAPRVSTALIRNNIHDSDVIAQCVSVMRIRLLNCKPRTYTDVSRVRYGMKINSVDSTLT